MKVIVIHPNQPPEARGISGDYESVRDIIGPTRRDAPRDSRNCETRSRHWRSGRGFWTTGGTMSSTTCDEPRTTSMISAGI